MKKIFVVILTIFILNASITHVFANESPELYEYHDEQYDIFIEKGGFSNEELDRIVYFIINEENSQSSQPYGISCTLFGHNYENTTAYVINHNVSVTAPRCISTTYDVFICSKCDHSTRTKVDSKYIYCC